MTALSVAGIDVSKARLDVFVLPQRISSTFDNRGEGIAALIGQLQQHNVMRVVLEATGGLEFPAARALCDAGLSVTRVQPGRVRGFRKFVGKHAKTDTIDAELIARFAMAMPQDDPRQSVPSEQAEAIRCLSARRRQLVDLLVQEKTRLRMTRDCFVLDSLRTVIAALKAERDRVEAALANAIAADERAARRAELLRSIPGIGPVVASVLITDLPELGTLNRHQVASLAGLAPHPQRSGTSQRGDHIGGGRACVRTALYMAAVASLRCNPSFKAFYKRLIAEGKPNKLAVVAVARKLVVLANAIVKSQQPWNPATSLV
ncbi:MAG TPA: IS110 family transposase [Rhizomicrobium sp.]|jgi:transposase